MQGMNKKLSKIIGCPTSKNILHLSDFFLLTTEEFVEIICVNKNLILCCTSVIAEWLNC